MEALLHTLLVTDLGSWHPRKEKPVTAALIDQKRQGLRGVEKLWFDALFSGSLPVGEVRKDGSMRVVTSDLEAEARMQVDEAVSPHAIGALFEQPPKHHDSRSPDMSFEKVDERPTEVALDSAAEECSMRHSALEPLVSHTTGTEWAEDLVVRELAGGESHGEEGGSSQLGPCAPRR